MQLYGKICLILATSENMHRSSLIQRIDDRLLYLRVQCRIQRIDPDRLVEDFFILRANLRHRIRHNREASFLTLDIGIHELPRFAGVRQEDLFLLLIQRYRFFLNFRDKWFLAKGLNHCRSCKLRCQFLVFLIRMLHYFQLPLDESFIQE